MKKQNKFSFTIIIAAFISLNATTFGQLPKGVKVPPISEFQGIHYSPNEPWPDTITQTEQYYNMIMSWRGFFIPSLPKIVVIESIPDTLHYNWFKPRPFVDEEGGGEPFWALPEKYMVIQYKKYSKTKTKWKNFINSTHSYWEKYYYNYLLVNYEGLSPSEIQNICDNIQFFYYEISPSDYRKNRFKDNYDQLKYWIFNQLNYGANSIDNSLDSIIFSKRLRQNLNDELPRSLNKYLEQLFSIEKKRLLIGSDSTNYKKLDSFRLSFELKKDYPFWFSNNLHSKVIYISPAVVRSIVTIALNSKTIAQDFDINKDVMHDDYYSYEERFLFYDFYYRKATNNSNQFNFVNRNINNLSNIDLFNASFFKKFTEAFSFILQHEMAHVYLARNEIGEQNEIKCDCYAMMALEHEIDDLPGGYDSQGMIAGDKIFNYGIVNTLLKGCIDNNIPELWNAKNIGDLNRRFEILKENQYNAPSKHECDSTFSK